MRDDIDARLDLFLNDTPLMDVRAPVEFRQGAFPNATNLPLLDDEQREAIGIRYKEAGQESAIELGLELATPDIREQRLRAWSDFARAHPDGYLYCFRGGLRSNTTQAWLREAGIDYPLIRGGYKALRRVLLDALTTRIDSQPLQVLAGPTGSGKTELIQAWPIGLDLEGRANHRGSAFGRTFTEQPSQIDWENRIAIDWAKLDREPHGPVLVEDESRLIGRINLLPELQSRMLAAPLIVLEADMQQRIDRLKTDYVRHALKHFETAEPDAPFEALQDYIANNLYRIRKRLGGLKHQQLQALLPQAVQSLEKQDDWAGFEQVIESLLTDYYDPMYRYQLEKRSHQVIFRGRHDAILDWLARQAA